MVSPPPLPSPAATPPGAGDTTMRPWLGCGLRGAVHRRPGRDVRDLDRCGLAHLTLREIQQAFHDTPLAAGLLRYLPGQVHPDHGRCRSSAARAGAARPRIDRPVPPTPALCSGCDRMTDIRPPSCHGYAHVSRVVEHDLGFHLAVDGLVLRGRCTSCHLSAPDAAARWMKAGCLRNRACRAAPAHPLEPVLARTDRP